MAQLRNDQYSEAPVSSGNSSTGNSSVLSGLTSKGFLANLLADDPRDFSLVVPILIEVVNCVERMHAAGRQHVPLSPTSIRLTESGSVQIASSAPSDTLGTVVFGSAKYSAPEAFLEGIVGESNVALDSYIIGFIFYELLLGNKLFKAEFASIDNENSPTAWWSWHTDQTKRARALSQVIEGFPLSISRLIEGMLQKDPSRRTTDLLYISATLLNATEKTVLSASLSPSSERAGPFPSPDTYTANGMSLRDAWLFWWSTIQKYSQRLRDIVKTEAKRVRSTLPKLANETFGSRVWASRPSKVSSPKVAEAVQSRLKTLRGQFGQTFFVCALLALSVALLVGIAMSLFRRDNITKATDAAHLQTSINTDSGEMELVQGGQLPGAANQHSIRSAGRTAPLPTFYIDRFEVSNMDYARFCKATGRSFPPNPPWDRNYSDTPDAPVLNVSWKDARAFADWSGKWLPSAVEWKAAAPLLKFHSEELAGLPADTDTSPLEWVDVDFREPSSNPRVRLIGFDSLKHAVVTGHDRGRGVVTFRCAASLDILDTKHVLSRARTANSSGLPKPYVQ
jgi:Sulfatase-modifying factor enzyme 1